MANFKPFLVWTLFFFAINANAQVEGRVILTSMGTDVQYRVGRTALHLSQYNCEKKTKANSGQVLMQTLEGEKSEPISIWVNFSHGNSSCLFGKDHRKKLCFYSNGLSLFPKNREVFDQNRSLGDLKWAVDNGEIQFAQDALIVIHACVAGSVNEKQGIIFAQELADITGATVIAGQHQTEPVIETEEEMTYSNVHQFVKFLPNEPPVLIGKALNLTKLLTDYIESKGTYTMADYPQEKWSPDLGNRIKAVHCLPSITPPNVGFIELQVKNILNHPKRNNKQV